MASECEGESDEIAPNGVPCSVIQLRLLELEVHDAAAMWRLVLLSFSCFSAAALVLLTLCCCPCQTRRSKATEVCPRPLCKSTPKPPKNDPKYQKSPECTQKIAYS